MTGEKPRVYLAGPIQHAGDHGKGWRARVKEEYDGFEWVDPLDKYDDTKSYDEIDEEWSNARIVEEDLTMIANCDAILVHWEEIPSAGTPMEVAYAIQVFEIPVVIQTTVEDMSIWLEVHAHEVVETFDDAVDALREEIQVELTSW